ncbi:helix-turn-helix domain-containing protein [Intrasporangium sp.]|uniref:winged helix-turn-helix transcriptional regulator n=1 Tax=Intrasporangium sp. TaxID=1925024 RepID=UPI00293A23CD|nr:helix-turn-helix domain-containing protein [Intrasporangium sp.]MDV3220451.1 helix-turn-helix transcriptional regulator [Intrasporangium sp.]
MADTAPREPVTATFDLLGDRLTLAILRSAFLNQTRRFGQWLKETGAPPAMLSERLNTLVEQGLLLKEEASSTRGEYLLTEKGLSVWPILVALWNWQREWSAEGALQPELVHDLCGHRGPTVPMCTCCGETVTPRDTRVELQPGVLASATTSGRRRSSRAPKDAVQSADFQFTEIMEVIGDRWSATVTGLALAGVRRFSEFRRTSGASPATLSERLSRLSRVGILVSGQDEPTREYRLTPRGRALFGVFVFLLDWSRVANPGVTPALHVVHERCGQVLAPAHRCRGCGVQLTRVAVRFEAPVGACPPGHLESANHTLTPIHPPV